MANESIIVENLGKRYNLGRLFRRNDQFREALMEIPGRLRRRLTQRTNPPRGNDSSPWDSSAEGPPENNELWALENVSFAVAEGEAVGIVGRNGAGKSTLLKILSRITPPTTGRAELYGKIGSLLEVGTGFHPELTGRENVYLNGAILGMKRQEVSRRFDEIVEFAEVERFLETPVKRYSSGMRVRLAFAVAAHLDPEILMIDEVLAVGDANFRRKCTEKIKSVSKERRTVLFISHNMGSIRDLCNRTLWLEKGRLVADGPSGDVIHQYLTAGTAGVAAQVWPDLNRAPGDEFVKLMRVSVVREDGEGPADYYFCNEPVDVTIEYRVLQNTFAVSQFTIVNDEGRKLFIGGEFQDAYWKNRTKVPGTYEVTTRIPGNLLNEGNYSLDLDLISYSQKLHSRLNSLVSFSVHDTLDEQSSRGMRLTSGWEATLLRPKFSNQYVIDGRPFNPED